MRRYLEKLEDNGDGDGIIILVMVMAWLDLYNSRRC